MTSRGTAERRLDERGLCEWVEVPPAPGLGRGITGYTGYLEDVAGPVGRLETPSGGAVLILSFGEELAVSPPPVVGAAPTGHPAGVFTSFAGGVSQGPVFTTHAGRQHGIQVRLDPLALYALFGVPLDELGRGAGGVVGLEDLGAGDWGERLGDAASWADRFAALDELLAGRLGRQDVHLAPGVVDAWRRLRAERGRLRIAQLVARSGMSHRTFIKQFRRHIGVSPKVAARILRYERATELLSRRPTSVAAVAADCGYADQAHLDREFAALAGCSPTYLAGRCGGAGGYQSVRSILFKPGLP